MSDFEIRGTHDLATMARRLKAAGRGDLRKELLAGIRESGKKAVPDIRRVAADTLPKRGGLADKVASQPYSVRTSLALSGAKVSIVGRGMKELSDIDEGRLRHPVFGDRSRWSQQSVTPGFFSQTIARRAPAIRDDIEKSMGHIAAEITGGFLR